MNKAFVREPEVTDDYCPHCGSKGVPVPEETLRAFLGPEVRRQLAPGASFCPAPTCGVAYFDSLERSVPVAALGREVYPKTPSAPICPCFQFHTAEIDQDLREGVVTRTRAAIERARSAQAQCLVHSPTGRSCQAVVQAYYMKHRGG